MSDIFSAALVHEVCPICCKDMNEQIIMNTVGSKKKAKAINDANGKAIGYSKDACEECCKHKDDGVYVIAIDLRSVDDGIYRTGQIACVNKNFQLFKDKADYILKTDNGVSFMFMEEEAGKLIDIFK
jgi:hypothetical protein